MVSYPQRGGGVISKQVKLGDLYGELPFPTKTGYSFVGWKLDNQLVTSTTQNVTQSDHTLTASWGHSVKFDYNNGTLLNSLSPTYAGEVGTTTSLPSDINPTYSGHTFAGWHYGKNLIEPTTFTGSNFIALGRDYMFTDKITITVRAYMDDWTEMSKQDMTLFSCTENGGWVISTRNRHDENLNYIVFSVNDVENSSTTCNYRCVYSSMLLSEMASGYHTLMCSFDGSYSRIYIDGVLVGESEKFSYNTIKYSSSNGIFVGAEASYNTTTPDYNFGTFVGKIDYVSIENSVVTDSGAYTYPDTYGNNLITPTTFTGSNFITLGRDYMFTDKITITVKASMDNWAEYGTKDMRLISCTEGGGWNFESDYNSGETHKLIRFVVCDSGVGYKNVTSSIPLVKLSSGYHIFTATFDGNCARIYIDGILAGTSEKFSSGQIGYNASNGVFVGAEAGSNTTTPQGRYFKGKIDYVAIENSVLSSTADYIYQDFDVVATAIWN